MSEIREGSPMSEGDHETEHSHICTGNSQSRNNIVEERRDLADTFELFKVYFDNKLVDLKSDLVREQDVISKKINEEVSLKFKHEGNKIQHKFNEEVITELNKVYSFVPRSETKQILQPAVWASVREYESNVIASDSEDEKKIRLAESRAMRTIKDKSRRPHPYKTTSRPVPVETAPNPYYVNHVNAVNPSHVSRSVADCKKKWQDLQAATKKKEATRRSEARATGGGPPPVCNFKPWESTVLQTLTKTQVEGIEGGVDTLEDDQFGPSTSNPPDTDVATTCVEGATIPEHQAEDEGTDNESGVYQIF
ncbi:unnamed protein product [Mytilus coruscus]|uniref:Uncharacterized protein n=1 Tax=Mytilus coruscus TaxID=42192 RepID=A0A6J8C8Z2_MYTCO|nr:unnamed protein product [Mytilus coruscus]